MSTTNKNISRRKFLLNLSWIIAIPYALLAGLSFKQNAKINRAKSISIPKEINNGVTFRDGLIVVKKDESVQFLSSKCTHLGCQIHTVENDELVCPCHGSRFALNGTCLKGPAKEPLKILNYEIDEINQEFVIQV